MDKNSNLTQLAKDCYFREVTFDKFRENFLSELQKRNVIDKREDGFYCSQCSKISKNQSAFVQRDRVVFPKKNDLELWIVNSHYDGCTGWD